MRLSGLLRALAALPIVTAACSLAFPAPTPMRVYRRAAEPGRTTRCLVVFLPGLGDTERDFVDHGFMDAFAARSLPVDAVAANATFGYYANRTVVTRLREDVLQPARAAGYREIWLVGISMGGMGALLLSKGGDPDIAGALLLAPYLGEADLLREIDRAGGVARWQPGAIRPDDYQRDVWRFLKENTGAPEGVARPRLYLAAGDNDKLAYGHKLLAASLPKDRVFKTPGRHDWGPWAVLWADFLDHSDFRARCGPQGD
jgi:pimeloyl-ACP methyl ester carboxylesterase